MTMKLPLDTCEQIPRLLVFPLHELVESLCLVSRPLLGELALARTEGEDGIRMASKRYY